MTRRRQLTNAQIAALFEPPTDPREMVRHYTLSSADLAIVRNCRGDQNRLGSALMLCYLRHPGRPMRVGEHPPSALISFVAAQIDVLPETVAGYLTAERAIRRHATEWQTRLGLRPYGPRSAADLASWLLPQAIENDRFAHLAGLIMAECRQRRIVVPSPRMLERLCIEVPHQARREVHRRLTDGLSADQRRQLDALTERRGDTGQSRLIWLRQMPEAAKPTAMLGLIERLDHLRKIGIETARGHRVHQARLTRLAHEAGRTTVQHIAGYERQRRHATLVAVTLDLSVGLTDQALNLFDRLIGAIFQKAEKRHARAFQADGRAINEKVCLFATVGAALIAAKNEKLDAFEAIGGVLTWERFVSSVAEAKALSRSEEFDPFQKLGEHYAGVRRWAPEFLEAFAFLGVPAVSPLLRAIEVLRNVNRTAASSLPESTPTAFIRPRWARHVLADGVINRIHPARTAG